MSQQPPLVDVTKERVRGDVVGHPAVGSSSEVESDVHIRSPRVPDRDVARLCLIASPQRRQKRRQRRVLARVSTTASATSSSASTSSGLTPRGGAGDEEEEEEEKEAETTGHLRRDLRSGEEILVLRRKRARRS